VTAYNQSIAEYVVKTSSPDASDVADRIMRPALSVQ
jgi:hypothetical protein